MLTAPHLPTRQPLDQRGFASGERDLAVVFLGSGDAEIERLLTMLSAARRG